MATPASRTTALIAALMGGALTLIAANPGWAGAGEDDVLASRFVTAPETAPDQQQLVGVEVNGVDLGSQLIRVSNGRITLPPVFQAQTRSFDIDGYLATNPATFPWLVKQHAEDIMPGDQVFI